MIDYLVEIIINNYSNGENLYNLKYVIYELSKCYKKSEIDLIMSEQ